MKKTFDTIEAVIADVRRGKMVIVVDDADRENEGDLIMAGQHITPAAINFMMSGVSAMPPDSAPRTPFGRPVVPDV